MKSPLLTFIFLFFAILSHAQVKTLEKNQTPGKGQVKDLSWMEGVWVGTGLGGECEEVWMPAVDT